MGDKQDFYPKLGTVMPVYYRIVIYCLLTQKKSEGLEFRDLLKFNQTY